MSLESINAFRQKLQKMNTEDLMLFALAKHSSTIVKELVRRLNDTREYVLELEDDYAKVQQQLVIEIKLRTKLNKSFWERVKRFLKWGN